MNSFQRLALVVSIAIPSLAGCAEPNAKRVSSAYERACSSRYMTGAAAREAYWCWQKAGVKSYAEWIALEQRTNQPDGARVEVALSQSSEVR